MFGWMTDVDGMNLWDQIKSKLASSLSEESYQNWVVGTSLQQVENDEMWVLVPNEPAREWIETEYRPMVDRIARDLGLPVRKIHFEVKIHDRTPSPTSAEAPAFGAANAQLNPKFTFERFVVGSCNQFAHAAAKAVATLPSKTYNPLFIYGGVGMGKTHLMHAIGRELQTRCTGMRIIYTSTERFMNEMISSIKNDRMPLFHQHYRTADILLVDDIQMLSGKERTQDEFFYTFNELYDHQKQIVLSSDSPPKNIPGLVERLRSRFEWGLMVDVQPPDLETKMAILDKKSEAEGITLPEDVRIYIATKTKSNVRELEGALVKLMAYSSVTGNRINLAMAQQVLNHLVNTGERRVNLDTIIRAVADRFSLQPSQLKQKTNAHHISHPRQIAMYLAKEMTGASLPEIGRAFGGKHHTTVLHSIQKVEQNRHKNADLNKLIHSIMDTIH